MFAAQINVAARTALASGIVSDDILFTFFS
jgi:hypothetical protein